eukprot:TRINITY_DN3927_c0_g1_i1.p1 TRINITY_DN3927_c0_g1~~TRINITY_DN3927_c0_g1_i1.p1  ORF type:complete len:420 (-),score=69.37 TRINITY_DN3927_c0_g1_i1:387-1646(-)
MGKKAKLRREATQNFLVLLKTERDDSWLQRDYYEEINFNFEDKRDRLVHEFLLTEQSYVRSLAVIINVWKRPLEEMLQQELFSFITDAKIHDIFGNIQDLYNVNEQLLIGIHTIIKDWSNTKCLGEDLRLFAHMLKFYTMYSKDYPRACDILGECVDNEEGFNDFLEETKMDPLCHGLDLRSYLIMPIQRIPRYRMLLEEIVEKTNQDHPDYQDLVTVLELVKQVADKVNTAVTEAENMDKLYRISKKFTNEKDFQIMEPGRKFILQGELMKICRKDNQKRVFFLFNDCLLYAYKGNKFKVGQVFYLNRAIIKDLPDSDEKKLYNAFQIIGGSKSCIVFAEDANEKNNWITLLYETIAELKSAYGTLQNAEKTQSVQNFAPVWVPDSQSKACSICASKFTMTHRRHHCRQVVIFLMIYF